MANEKVSLTFDNSGRLSTFHNKEANIKLHLEQDWIWYNASAGNNAISKQPSGAYIMRPNSSVPFPFATQVNVTYYNGVYPPDRCLWFIYFACVLSVFVSVFVYVHIMCLCACSCANSLSLSAMRSVFLSP
jgi:hypothetical protein